MEGLIEGKIVHYVMNNGEHRPAIVVRVWSGGPCEGYVNLQVFTDGSNDCSPSYSDAMNAQIAEGTLWRTSICYNEAKSHNTWHWIEQA